MPHTKSIEHNETRRHITQTPDPIPGVIPNVISTPPNPTLGDQSLEALKNAVDPTRTTANPNPDQSAVAPVRDMTDPSRKTDPTPDQAAEAVKQAAKRQESGVPERLATVEDLKHAGQTENVNPDEQKTKKTG